MLITAVTLLVHAQAPQKMSYQCIIRNSSGGLIANQSIGLKISILQGTSTGAVVFSETYNPNPQTNANGLLTVEIGGGLTISGNFSAINWGSGPYYIKMETDPTGGTNYTITGTSQLLSVPFALYANNGGNVSSNNWADISGKPSTLAGYGIIDADGSVTNELQFLSLSGTILTLSNGGGTVTLPSSGGGDNWGTQVVNTNTTLIGQGTSSSPLGVANSAITPTWANVQGKPIFAVVSSSGNFSDLLSRPTTLAGYGITDAVNISGNQTIAGTKTFTGTINASNRTITNVGNPTNAQDAATKVYVDNILSPIIFQEATQSIIGNNSPLINNGYRNIFVGKSSGMNNVSGTYNIFLGSEAGLLNSIGNNNIAIGQNALRENDEGSENIAIGTYALEKNKVLVPGSLGNNGFGNIAVGFEAMRNATSFDNVAIGAHSLRLITEGTANTALGIHTMRSMINGGSNTAVGAAAMINSVSGSNNIAIGRDAGNEIAGSENVFIGNESGRINHGSANIFIGHLSGYGELWQNVSNRLIIHNAFNGTDLPLIYGEFDNSFLRINGTVNVRDVLKLTPKATAPVNPSEGDIYYNSTTHKLMVFDGSSWMACW